MTDMDLQLSAAIGSANEGNASTDGDKVFRLLIRVPANPQAFADRHFNVVEITREPVGVEARVENYQLRRVLGRHDNNEVLISDLLFQARDQAFFRMPVGTATRRVELHS